MNLEDLPYDVSVFVDILATDLAKSRVEVAQLTAVIKKQAEESTKDE